MPGRVLAVGAHPDDIEFVMAGTLFLLVRAGWETHYLNLADGRCGAMETDGETTARLRAEEARAACARLGAHWHPPLTRDAEILYTPALLRQVTAVVREVAPHIVLAPSPQDYMEDHTETARLAASAAFCRGMPNWQSDPPRPPVAETVALYHAQPYGNRDALGDLVRPRLFVDIGAVLEEKTGMLAEHRSQKEWLDKSQGVDAYLETLRAMGREVGGLSGRFEYAEGWRRHNPLGLGPAAEDPLAEALAPFAHIPS